MRKISLIAIVLVFLTSCGANYAVMSNMASHQTHVELSQSNFRVIRKVSGSSQAVYILGIGGLSNRFLFENAKNEMFKNAGIEGSTNQAVAFITYDTYIGGAPPLFLVKKITATGYLIEYVP